MAYEALRCPQRQAALAAGEKFYVTGRPCKHGHVAERYTRSTSCRECERTRVRTREYKAYASDYARKQRYLGHHRLTNPIGILVRGARDRAKERGIAFDITKDDLVMPERCPCCDRRIFVDGTKTRAADHSPSIDRMNSALGYIKGNVEIICWRCNNLKSDATAAELRAIADWMDRKAAEHNVGDCAVRAPRKAVA